MATELEASRRSRSQSQNRDKKTSGEMKQWMSYLGLAPKGEMPKRKPAHTSPMAIQTLNARGMPTRKRKPNSLLFDEDHIYEKISMHTELLVKNEKQVNDGKELKKEIFSKSAGFEEYATRKNWAHVKQRLETAADSRFVIQPRNTQRLLSQAPLNSIRKRNELALPLEFMNLMRHKTLNSRQSKSELAAASRAAARTAAQKALAKAAEKLKANIHQSQCARKLLKSPQEHNYTGHRSLRQALNHVVGLVKSRRFIVSEYFYSYIDRHIFFDARDDFRCYVPTKYISRIKFRMSRVVWRSIRRVMGKPRRFSAAFVGEQLRLLYKQRQLIRKIQKRKAGESIPHKLLKDLPMNAPLPLPIATLVTAVVHKPLNSVYSGTITAYDSVQATYLVRFHKSGLGTFPVPDTAITSDSFSEIVPLPELQDFSQPRIYTCKPDAKGFVDSTITAIPATMEYKEIHLKDLRAALSANSDHHEPLKSLNKQKREHLIIYPRKMLKAIARLRTKIDLKRHNVQRISDINDQIERAPAEPWSAPELNTDLARIIASAVTVLQNINADITHELAALERYSPSVIKELWLHALLTPDYLYRSCTMTADVMVDSLNLDKDKESHMQAFLKDIIAQMLVSTRANESRDSRYFLDNSIESLSQKLIAHKSCHFYKRVIQPRLQLLLSFVRRRRPAISKTKINTAHLNGILQKLRNLRYADVMPSDTPVISPSKKPEKRLANDKQRATIKLSPPDKVKTKIERISSFAPADNTGREEILNGAVAEPMEFDDSIIEMDPNFEQIIHNDDDDDDDDDIVDDDDDLIIYDVDEID